jgi:RNA polymerase sigma factor (TIGR02999 family)
VTQLLHAASEGDSRAASALLPMVYEELRQLASARLAREPGGGAGFTLQPTALVHEAYMRLVGSADVRWDGRAHFFGAAALAMRRILVERARQKSRIKHGGNVPRADVDVEHLAQFEGEPEPEALLALDSALEQLATLDSRKHEVVMLRYFAGLSIEDTAHAVGVSPATVKNDWVFARAWLKRAIAQAGEQPGDPGAGRGA